MSTSGAPHALWMLEVNKCSTQSLSQIQSLLWHCKLFSLPWPQRIGVLLLYCIELSSSKEVTVGQSRGQATDGRGVEGVEEQ